jgi:hypothetical protein
VGSAPLLRSRLGSGDRLRQFLVFGNDPTQTERFQLVAGGEASFGVPFAEAIVFIERSIPLGLVECESVGTPALERLVEHFLRQRVGLASNALAGVRQRA